MKLHICFCYKVFFLFRGTGKYQASQSPLDELVDSQRNDAIKNSEGNDTSNKRIYEDTLLLNETKSKDGEQQNGRGKISSPTSDIHTSRKSYRKKHKLKHDKKKSSHHHYNVNNGETVLSDSDVN